MNKMNVLNIVLNQELNGVEVYFNSKPGTEERAELKGNGFRWNGNKGCWYAKQSNNTIKFANRLKDVVTDGIEEILVAKKNNTKGKINLFELTTFTKIEVEKNYNTKEIAKEIRTHLKSRFKFVKFSVTSKSSRISVDIKEAPFKKGSIYLSAVLEYVRQLVDNHNYCTCYDPYGDYGSSYNFYSHVDVDYNYKETEQSEDIKEAIKDFDIQAAEAKEAKRIEEELRWEKLQEEEELRKKEAQERANKEAEQKEYIYNNTTVTDIEEKNQYYIKNAYFAKLNKNNTIEEYRKEVESGEYYLNTLKVTKEVHFKNTESLEYFQEMLLHDFSFIEGTGGSFTEDKRINDMMDYNNMEEWEKCTVEWLLEGVAVYYNNELKFVIDAQGYSYSRYVGLVGELTENKKDYICKQVISEDKIIAAKEELNKIEPIIEYTIGEDSYSIRKNLADNIRMNNIELSKTIIQQAATEHKEILYRVLNECDLIQDQFNANTFIQGEELTIIRSSIIAGASVKHVKYESHECIEYAQYKDNVSLKMKVKNKKGVYSVQLYDKDILICRGWIEIPESILYEDSGMNSKITKYGSYDRQSINDILEYLKKKNQLPIINTFKPVF